jgi:FtsH-binding integral membrane protein
VRYRVDDDAKSRDAYRLGVEEMMRTIYQILMSAFVGTVVGCVVTNLVNIMDPDIQMDYEVAIAFFGVITWGLLALLDTLFRKVNAQPAEVASAARR